MKYIKNFTTILLIILLTPFIAFCHAGFLKGTVTDNITGAPMSGVNVSFSGTPLKTITDATGHFDFNPIPAKEYEIIFEKEGYTAKEFKVNIQVDDTLRLNITLRPSVIDLPAMMVTAEKPLSAASSSIINKLDFELRPKNSAQDMLRLAPGLFIAQHAGGGKAEQIFVRGFDCDHGTDVATLWTAFL